MTAEVLIFPDAGEMAIAVLKAAFTAHSISSGVGSKVPHPLTGTFVQVTRSGGLVTQRVIDKAQLTFEAYADTEGTAHDTIQFCRGVMHAMEGTQQGSIKVSGVTEIVGPLDLPDTITNKPRFQMVLQIGVRGVAL